MASREDAKRKALTRHRSKGGLPPIPSGADEETRQFLQAVQDNLAVLSGQAGLESDRAATVGELQRSGGTTVQQSVDSSPDGGPTSERPANPESFQPYFDTDLGKPIWYTGSDWVDATGSVV